MDNNFDNSIKNFDNGTNNFNSNINNFDKWEWRGIEGDGGLPLKGVCLQLTPKRQEVTKLWLGKSESENTKLLAPIYNYTQKTAHVGDFKIL
jgi:hypothetical protein